MNNIPEFLILSFLIPSFLTPNLLMLSLSKHEDWEVCQRDPHLSTSSR